MDRNNALGLTLHPDPEVFNVPDLDWDSVTMVSLETIPPAIDQKHSFFKLGRWTSGERRLSITPVWRTAGSQWRRKYVPSALSLQPHLIRVGSPPPCRMSEAVYYPLSFMQSGLELPADARGLTQGTILWSHMPCSLCR